MCRKRNDFKVVVWIHNDAINGIEQKNLFGVRILFLELAMFEMKLDNKQLYNPKPGKMLCLKNKQWKSHLNVKARREGEKA